jgi:plasmid replication initiation protein
MTNPKHKSILMAPLLPDRHPNYDLFICDVLDAIPKDDMASMEHPVFSLATKQDMRHLRYEHNGNTLEIIPSGYGLATIHDKDVLIFVISQLIAKMKDGYEPGRTIILRAYDLLIATNKETSGDGYRRLKTGLDRLAGTRIKTNIKTNNVRITKNFGLIDSYEIVERSPVDERMVAIKITLSDWLYNAVVGFEVLTLHRDYFRLRKPMERRIYELARKHCGANEKWTVKLETLKTKIGTTAQLKKFRFNVRKLVETNHLPDYKISLLDDVVTFTSRRTSGREGNVRLPQLTPEAFEKAKRAAPGWDVYRLESEWREWIAGKEKPKNPGAAFIAFCRKKCRREGRP